MHFLPDRFPLAGWPKIYGYAKHVQLLQWARWSKLFNRRNNDCQYSWWIWKLHNVFQHDLIEESVPKVTINHSGTAGSKLSGMCKQTTQPETIAFWLAAFNNRQENLLWVPSSRHLAWFHANKQACCAKRCFWLQMGGVVTGLINISTVYSPESDPGMLKISVTISVWLMIVIHSL